MRINDLMLVAINSTFVFFASSAMEEQMSGFVPRTKSPTFLATHLIQAGCMNTIDEHGHTALHDIARNQIMTQGLFENATKLLKDNLVDPNAQDDAKKTASHYAAINGHHELMFLFLNHGSSLEIPDEKGKTIVQLIKDSYIKEIIQLCMIPDAVAKSKSPLDSDMLSIFHRVLLTKKESPHAYKYFFDHVSLHAAGSFMKYTALHCAVLLKAVEEFNFLVSRGAPVTYKDSLGFTVLALMVQQEFPAAIIEPLLKRFPLALLIPAQSGATVIQGVTSIKDSALRRIINKEIIEFQLEKYVGDFDCPFCGVEATYPFEFIDPINEKCGHILCKQCKEQFKGICPWCPAQRFDFNVLSGQ